MGVFDGFEGMDLGVGKIAVHADGGLADVGADIKQHAKPAGIRVATNIVQPVLPSVKGAQQWEAGRAQQTIQWPFQRAPGEIPDIHAVFEPVG